MIDRFVRAEKANHDVKTMCRLFGVSRSGYYAWRSRPPSARRVADGELTRAIVRIHEASRGTYGRPRVQAELRYEGTRCSGKRVARLMRTAGLHGIPSRRRRGLTRRRPGVARHRDLVQRDFGAKELDRLWVADISYVPTGQGWLYLATILDCCSRRIVPRRVPTGLVPVDRRALGPPAHSADFHGSTHALGCLGERSYCRDDMAVLGLTVAVFGVIGLRLRYGYARMHVHYAYNLRADDPRGDRLRRFLERWVAVASWILVVLGAASVVVGIATGQWLDW